MRAGNLRERVRIERPIETQNAIGEPTTVWELVADVSAEVLPLSGSESYFAAQRNAKVSHLVRMRYVPGITAKMRAVYKTRLFNIVSTLDVEERSRELNLHCE